MFRMNHKQQNTLIVIGLALLTLALLIPMLLMARYSFRSADDFAFAYETESIWNSTHSLWSYCVGVFQYDLHLWNTWQGLYFADFIYPFIIGLTGDKYYFITIFLTLIPMMAAELYAAKVIVKDLLKVDIRYAFMVSLPVIIFQMQLPASASEGFYWMCGGMAYTTAFAFSMLMVATMVKAYCAEKISISLSVVIFFLAFIIGGSNYVVALFDICFYFVTLVLLWKRKKPMRTIALCGFGAFIVFFLANALAPGNSVRQSMETEGYPPINAVIQSLVEALRYVKTWWFFVVTLLLIALLPVMVHIAKETEFTYKWPLVFMFVTFGLYACQFTPTMYALGNIGPFRARNIYRWTMYILLVANEWYIVGWAVKRNFSFLRKCVKFFEKIGRIPLGTLAYALIMVVCMAPFFLWYYGPTVSIQASWYPLRNGQAKIYLEEWNERLPILEDDSITDPVFEPFSDVPYLIGFSDITEDPEHWINWDFAHYWGKNTVRIKSR